MKKTIKIILIIILSILILIPVSFFAMFGISELNLKLEKTKLEKQAIINVENYIEEKYPEKALSVKTASADENYDGFVQSGWDDRVDVYVEDENKTEYHFVTDASLTDKEGADSCRDNVQLKEIKDAIENEIEKYVVVDVQETFIDGIVVDKKKEIEIDFVNTGYDTLYHKKFDGDIIKFLKTETNGYDEPLEPAIWFSYCDGKMSINENINTDFFDLLDFVAIIEFKDTIPNTPDYTHLTAESIYEVLERFSITPKSIYYYHKSSQNFINYMDYLIITV